MRRIIGFALLCGSVLFPLRSAEATDVELVTRANPPSDTPWSASNFGPNLFLPSVSDDDRYVAFSSISPNLVPGQRSATVGYNIFLWDRTTGTSRLVSHAAGNPLSGAAGSSRGQGLSSDGRYVAFLSTATDLVAGQVDAPETSDVFFWDRTTGLVRLVSHAHNSAVTVGDRPTYRFALSADGRYVAFAGDSSNFLPGGSTTEAVYLWDRDTGGLTLVSHRAGLPAEPAMGLTGSVSISGDGGVVAFDSLASDLVAGQVDTSGRDDVFLWTRATNSTVLASRVAGTVATSDEFADSYSPILSRNGRWLAFRSTSPDLIPGGDGNSGTDVYLFDALGGTNTLVSHASGQPNVAADNPSFALAISADAGEILFSSMAANLVPGQVDTNSEADTFLWRRALDQTILVSHRIEGAQVATHHGGFGGSMSADGRFAAFLSTDPDLAAGQNDPPTSSVDVFVFDRDSGVVSLASHRNGSTTDAGNDESIEPIVSPGGNFLTFTTNATDIQAGIEDWNVASDLYLYDRGTTANRLITRVAELSDTQSVYFDFAPSRAEISSDGRWVAFSSPSANLTGGTRSGFYGNVFLRDRQSGTTCLISRSAVAPNAFGLGQSQIFSMSADGRYVAYQSEAPDLVAGQVDSFFRTTDVFLFDREADSSALVSHRPGQPNVSDLSNHFTKLPRISADGRFVAYYGAGIASESEAGLYLFDRTLATSALVTHLPGQPSASALGGFDEFPSLSADGRFIAYSSSSKDLVAGVSDVDNTWDIFLYDRTNGENLLITRMAGSPDQAAGFATEPTISADGRFVAFTGRNPVLLPGPFSSWSNVYLWDRVSDSLALVSHTPGGDYGNGHSNHPAISSDGRYVAFSSQATDLVPGQTDIEETPDTFLFDRATGAVILASHAPGAPATAIGSMEGPGLPALSADGRKLAFSTATGIAVTGQIAPGGLFVYDRMTDSSLLASHRPGEATRPGNAPGTSVTFSADGASTCFSSTATDLVARDYNGATDVFVHQISTAAPTGSYFTVSPCRLLDTRTADQTPALASAAIRAVTVTGRCAVPTSAQAIAVTLTVTGGTGGGHLSLFPGNLTVPATAALNFAAMQTRSSNAIASLATNGAGTLGLSAFVGGDGTVEAIVDVFGYFE